MVNPTMHGEIDFLGDPGLSVTCRHCKITTAAVWCAWPRVRLGSIPDLTFVNLCLSKFIENLFLHRPVIFLNSKNYA